MNERDDKYFEKYIIAYALHHIKAGTYQEESKDNYVEKNGTVSFKTWFYGDMIYEGITVNGVPYGKGKLEGKGFIIESKF